MGEKIKISRIKYEDGIQLFEKGNETGNTIYISQDNMFIVDQEQIDHIYNLYKDLEVYSFEGDSIMDPALDVGDILMIDNKKVIYQGSSQYAGKFKASISSKIQCKAKEETMNRSPSQKKINRRVQSEIDQANGKITQLVEETSKNSDKLTKVEQDIESIKQIAKNTVDYKRQAEGITQVYLLEAGKAEVLKLEVQGNKTYKNYLFPRTNLYPKSNLHPN